MSAYVRAPLVRVRSVDERGVTVLVAANLPLDVLVDGRRVWTFWSGRDTEPVLGPAVRRAAWPRSLKRYLDGRARLTVRASAGGRTLFDRDLRFGDSDGPIEIRTSDGVELGIDKSGRLVPTFGGRSEANIEALLDASEAVLDALRSHGLEPFVAYGTLLGAVREGRVLPHDSDADLGYVSRLRTPVDVARESFRVQRALVAQGWRISRYSGAAFKIDVEQGGVRTGLDVFGGFYDRGEGRPGRLYLMGEIGADFREEWVFPLGTATLEGRSFPVPAEPERLLEAMYGPHWRVPDPAFKFSTPARTVRALDDWFRGTQPNVRYWARRANATADRPLRGGSPLAKKAATAARRLGAEVLDVGAGRGQDSLWLARQGLSVTAYDYVPRALDRAAAEAAAQGLDLTVRYLNLTEWRSVLAEGARLAHDPRPRVVLARHTIDATSAFGRASLARLCSMALRDGGRLLADLYVDGGIAGIDEGGGDGGGDGGGSAAEPVAGTVGRVDLSALTTLLREAGATRVDVRERTMRGRPAARVVGVW